MYERYDISSRMASETANTAVSEIIFHTLEHGKKRSMKVKKL
jgi:hypothetical protein